MSKKKEKKDAKNAAAAANGTDAKKVSHNLRLCICSASYHAMSINFYKGNPFICPRISSMHASPISLLHLDARLNWTKKPKRRRRRNFTAD
jgi:hypothetical protein